MDSVYSKAVKIATNGLKIGAVLKNAQNPTPAIAAMCGYTPCVIENAWHDGSLKYLVFGHGRVSTIERIASELRVGVRTLYRLAAVPKFGKRFL